MTIKQRFDGDKQRKDCFLCCAAMALGLTYDEAWRRAGDLQPVFLSDGKGPRDKQCDLLLLRLGGLERNVDYHVLFMMPEYATPGFLRNILWGRRALAQVPSKNFAGEQHIVYWDGRGLHDPSNLRCWFWDEVSPIYVWIFLEASAPRSYVGGIR